MTNQERQNTDECISCHIGQLEEIAKGTRYVKGDNYTGYDCQSHYYQCNFCHDLFNRKLIMPMEGQDHFGDYSKCDRNLTRDDIIRYAPILEAYLDQIIFEKKKPAYREAIRKYREAEREGRVTEQFENALLKEVGLSDEEIAFWREEYESEDSEHHLLGFIITEEANRLKDMEENESSHKRVSDFIYGPGVTSGIGRDENGFVINHWSHPRNRPRNR